MTENSDEVITSRIASQYKVVADWYNGKETFEKATIESKRVSEATGKYNLINGQSTVHNLATSYADLEALTKAIDEVKTHKNDCEIKDCEDETHIVELTKEQKASAMAKYSAEHKISYKYLVALKTKSSYSTKQIDLNGQIKVIKRSASLSTAAPTADINSIVGYDSVTVNGMEDITNDAPVVDFSEADDEVELMFNNYFSFTVNASHQNNLFLGYNQKPNSDILDQNIDANIDFITFTTKPVFNRIGKFRVFTDKDKFIYELTDKGLKAINATYDEDYDAYVFNTRTLSSYVISDKELSYEMDNSDDTETPVEPKPETKPEEKPSKPNPDTGAGNGTGIASVLAVLSLVGAGAIMLKKSK